MHIFLWIVYILLAVMVGLVLYDRFFQSKNLVQANYPLLGRGRYIAHFLRPFVRQYFLDDNEFTDRLVIDWVLKVAEGKTGYFGFDKFDSAHHLHNGHHQMIHAPSPKNDDEMQPVYPVLGQGHRKYPLAFKSYFYRSAMSLGALSFEATSAMFAACADVGAPANTGEGGFSVHHIPRVKFSKDRTFFTSKPVPKILKIFYWMAPGKRLKNYIIDVFGAMFLPRQMRDAYLFDTDDFVFYKIDWSAPLSAFPKPEDLTDEFGHIIFQIGSNLNGLRKPHKDGTFEFDWDRFAKITSFVRAIEVKLGQGAKQTGGVLKAVKNTKVIAEIRGIAPHTDLHSPNRFPFYDKGDEAGFLAFCEHLSAQAGGKPVGAKVVISNHNNVEPLIKAMAQGEDRLDFITVDGGDGGSGAAPIALSVLFGKKIHDAIPIVDALLKKYKLREDIKLLASSKLYAPHMSARVLALGADAIGNARSIMIAGGCIRAGHCSGEYGPCPVGIATMNKSNRRAYAQAWDRKVQQIGNYISAHNKGIVQVAAVCGIDSPSKFGPEHLVQA